MNPYVNLIRGDGLGFDLEILLPLFYAYPTAFCDPQQSAQEITFWICHDREYKLLKEAAFKRGKRSGLYSMGFVTLRSTFLTVGLETLPATLMQMSNLLTPIMQQYQCKVFNEYGLDLSHYYGDPERMFYPTWTPPDVDQRLGEWQAQQ